MDFKYCGFWSLTWPWLNSYQTTPIPRDCAPAWAISTFYLCQKTILDCLDQWQINSTCTVRYIMCLIRIATDPPTTSSHSINKFLSAVCTNSAFCTCGGCDILEVPTRLSRRDACSPLARSFASLDVVPTCYWALMHRHCHTPHCIHYSYCRPPDVTFTILQLSVLSFHCVRCVVCVCVQWVWFIVCRN